MLKMSKNLSIYVLGLEQNKYYVGKTMNPQMRLEDHFNNCGSAWTQKYKPIKLIDLIPNCDDYDEDKYTLMYMDKYGIDNVRGGSYTTIYLDASTRKHLDKQSLSVNDRCFTCGQKGHFAKACKNKEKGGPSGTTAPSGKEKCKRCGRDHPTTKCYAKTDIQGNVITSSSSSTSSTSTSSTISSSDEEILGKKKFVKEESSGQPGILWSIVSWLKPGWFPPQK